MEAIINIQQEKFNNILRLGIIIILCFLAVTILSNIAVAYDFSGGYTSSQVVGVEGGNILTIGFSTGSYIDVGIALLAETPVTPTAIPSLNIWLYLIAFALTGFAYWHEERVPYILSGLALITIGFTAWATSYYLSILLVAWGVCNFAEASLMRRVT